MSRITPSTLENKQLCPCFDYRQKEDGGDAASEGILLHKSAETEDLSILETEEQKECVENSLVYLRGILAGHIDSMVRTIMKEMKVSIPILKCNGYIDWFCLLTDNTAEFADLKFGRRGATNAEDNLQCICYALALWERFPEVTSVRAHIVNARLRESVVPFIFEQEMKPAMEAKVKKVMDSADDPFKVPCAAEPDLCVRCAHSERCPAISKTVQQVCTGVIEDRSSLPSVFKLSEITNVADMAKIHMLAPAVIQWFEDQKRKNVEFVKAGGVIPGLKLVSRTGTKNLTNTMDVVERLQSSATLATFDILATCQLSFVKLAEQLAAVRKITNAEARTQLEAVLGTLVAEGFPVTYLQKTRVSKKKGGDDQIEG